MSFGLHEVSVRFGPRMALDRVSLTVDPGEVTVVVGGDGAGKSSALAALVGLLRPETGRVSRPPKSDLGYVPASAGLYVDLSVEENIAFVASAYGVPASQRDARADTLLERMGLTSARRRLAGALSGGMQRKLAVVLALLSEPRLLVLDEPTTGIDPLSRVEIWRLLSTTAASGVAIVVATTYVNEAARGTSAVLLSDARVLTAGAPEDILATVPGTLRTCPRRPEGPVSAWRRGSAWRVWSDQDVTTPTCERVEPDFEDAVVIAELAQELER